MSDILYNIERLARRSVDRCSDRSMPLLLCHQSLCVIDGLAARQASLLFQFTRNITLWNNHCAPILLRSMVECFITFSWICRDPIPRSEAYFSYGIGQARQFADIYAELSDKSPSDESLSHERDFNIAFASSFRHLAFVDVNLGSWADKSIRLLAKEIDQDILYKTAFSEYSANAHNTFYHVAIHNMRPCNNESHPLHLVKRYDDGTIDLQYITKACRYFDLLINDYNDFSGIIGKNDLLSRYTRRNLSALIDEIKLYINP